MTKEFEQPRFRRGESANKPYLRHVADTPFAKALSDISVDRGHESQSSLARSIGKRQEVVRRWLVDKGIPSPEVFGSLLIRFQPNDEKMEALVSAYAQEISQGRGMPGRNTPEGRIAGARRSRGHPDTPVGQWIKKFCDDKGITYRDFFKEIGFGSSTDFGKKERDSFGLEPLNLIRQNGRETLGLSEEQKRAIRCYRFDNTTRIRRREKFS